MKPGCARVCKRHFSLRVGQGKKDAKDLRLDLSAMMSIPPLRISQDRISLTYHSKFMFIGSCFSEAMSSRLLRLKFNCQVNPSHGILFNPSSIAASLARVSSLKYYHYDDIVAHPQNSDTYHSWEHHSCFSSTSRSDMVDSMNNALDEAHDFLRDCDTVFITLGTSRVHILQENRSSKEEKVVANCHKFPSSYFSRRMLSISEVEDNLKFAVDALRHINPSIEVVLTVSPVRHLREDAIENSLSKSILLCAIHNTINSTNGRGNKFRSVQYFPSFEIMMDELRDYRFYKEDFVHPSSLAEDIIFDRFVESFVAEGNTRSIIGAVSRLNRGLSHRPLLASSQAHKNHLHGLLSQIDNIDTIASSAKIDSLDFSSERKEIAEILSCNF